MIERGLVALTLLAICASQTCAAPAWVSPNHYRTIITVDTRGVANRTSSPVALDIDLKQVLADLNAPGAFDQDTVEVIGYSSAGQPVVFDATRPGYERYLLPWRVDRYYGISRITLHFVIPNSACTQYAVYFDTKESGLGKPQRYHGLVGDGDNFRQGYGRREINANEHDSWADLDGDGDLDLFKGAVEPFIFCYENVGGGKFVEAGRLTSGGNLLQFPVYEADGNRSWHTVTFVDWEGDGDQDLMVHFVAGYYGAQVMRYENITPPGGPFTFALRGPLTTTDGAGFTWITGMCFVDWDGDGDLDLLGGRDGCIEYYRNDGTRSNPAYVFDSYLGANGREIRLYAATPDVADIDSDGDLDLICCSDPGKVYWFENIGTRTDPVFPQGRLLVAHDGGYEDARGRVKVADFDGDGLLDLVVGRYWERTHYGEQDRVFGRMYKNIGTPTAPRFTPVTAENGAPYIEGFRKCDAVMQNSVRGVDWNDDGIVDIIAGDTDGFVWFFRNLTGGQSPIFAPGEKILSDGKPLHVNGEEDRRTYAGYARPAVCDWNEDGRKDLLVASGGGWLWLYLNRGTQASPEFGPGVRVTARHSSGQIYPIDGTARASVLVCDWDNDGKKDVIFAMSGEGNPSEFFSWPVQPGRSIQSGEDLGFLFYRNIGSNENPSLDYPQWIMAGEPPTPITYNNRPTLGAFVDWNGDGAKDFIGSEFEHNVRMYQNTTGGGFGVKPEFGTSSSGIKIVAPWTVQMMSAPDAVDFNGDGDTDIITGMGHGGSWLRFWERDYIDDKLNDTIPIATAGSSGLGVAVREAKTLASGQPVTLTRGVVTAVFADSFYIQSEDRTSGIRIEMAEPEVIEGQVIDVTGTLATGADGERCIVGSSVVLNSVVY